MSEYVITYGLPEDSKNRQVLEAMIAGLPGHRILDEAWAVKSELLAIQIRDKLALAAPDAKILVGRLNGWASNLAGDGPDWFKQP